MRQEAQRVHSPPTSSDPSEGPCRGLFFDLAPTTNESQSDSSPDVQLSATPAIQRRAVNTGSSPIANHEWWEVERAMVTRGDILPPNFELDAPEHLPGSPLCPMDPKHKSGGKGICVYHGRRGSAG